MRIWRNAGKHPKLALISSNICRVEVLKKFFKEKFFTERGYILTKTEIYLMK